MMSSDINSFDWNIFLNQNDITEREWSVATAKSSIWVTCACGSLCKQIPRTINGRPVDRLLTQLGLDFFKYITEKDIINSKKTLIQLEKRSIELIKEINEKAKGFFG